MNSNNTDLHKTELLAPAGSYEAFEAALGAGADAVYVGGPAFGARAYARNFTVEELIRAIHIAHIHWHAHHSLSDDRPDGQGHEAQNGDHLDQCKPELHLAKELDGHNVQSKHDS